MIYGIPGWLSYHRPRAQNAFPLLFVPPMYFCVFIWFACLGCWVMRKVTNRLQPRPYAIVIAIATCVVMLLAIDMLIEGEFMMRLGFYAETGV
jgi:hypothetical protein